ncbi:hypothetical protein A676_01529 [Salmonella enterica subsp. enterica serovar Enteritidis str. 2010K-0262]|nr:hypothetical protein A671_02748 [Salmonella enterica subsp. enterica serovar Dublin str. DG22]EPI85125.1 hypothetical protein A674_03306 [Salmonella enterica subsp. enterica serovar Enteritidis str. 2009K1651]EPI88232.1 hypothetical protein A676_01529 [Salmonella enterica subsp. enterica serovar Enteritidis str. 2010K-0262]EPJ03573.1 hypothetical protein A677_00723 [Salmonella enterica subsp. enterica serovar Enteritidis str. 2010K-0267]
MLRCLSSPDFPEEPPEGGFFLRLSCKISRRLASALKCDVQCRRN